MLSLPRYSLISKTQLSPLKNWANFGTGEPKPLNQGKLARLHTQNHAHIFAPWFKHGRLVEVEWKESADVRCAPPPRP